VISPERLARRTNEKDPIIVVSGLPRSGTSMAMRMLAAGGCEILTDGIRTADASNPNGYYELEAVKGLDKNGDLSWLNDARGRAVKIISFLVQWLPETYEYRVVFMKRDLDEVITSQNRMLLARGEPADPTADERIRELYRRHLAKVKRLMASRACFSVLEVGYRNVLAAPMREARPIGAIVDRPLQLERMAEVADPALYRNRAPAPPLVQQ
jgi:hypothetical protein